MWANRRTLIDTTADGANVVFHLLVPFFEVVAIEDPVVFLESLHPLVIKGELYRGSKLVWFYLLEF
jgi:hypothetical protein